MKNEQEKKEYTTPAMEVVTFEHRANLLQASEEMPQNMGVDWDD